MDLFGIRSHDEQHQTAERTLRRLVEQVAQLSIDVGQTRTDMRRLSLVVEGKVSAEVVDPALVEANSALGRAREQLGRLQASADEQWNEIRRELDASVAEAAARAAELDSSS